jgi:hypothetical protein
MLQLKAAYKITICYNPDEIEIFIHFDNNLHENSMTA